MTRPHEGTEPETEAPTPQMPDASAGWLLAERAAWHLLEKAATDLVVLDLRGRSDVCDFFVLATGQTANHIRALSRHVQDKLLDAGHRSKEAEGMDDGRWVLMDYFDVVVHVFAADARDYFQLERLWGDAPRLDLPPEWFGDASCAARHPDLRFNLASAGDGGEGETA